MQLFHVTFRAWNGQQRAVHLAVHETEDRFGICYYATDLGAYVPPHDGTILGCGKSDHDPRGAVHRLVQDHGTPLSIEPV